MSAQEEQPVEEKIEPWILEDVVISQKNNPLIIMSCGEKRLTVGFHMLVGKHLRFRCSERGCSASHLFKVNVPEIYTEERDDSTRKRKKLVWTKSMKKYEKESFSHIVLTTAHICDGRDPEYFKKLKAQSKMRIKIMKDQAKEKAENENRKKATLPTKQTVKMEPDLGNLIPWGPPEDEFEEDFLVTENARTRPSAFLWKPIREPEELARRRFSSVMFYFE